MGGLGLGAIAQAGAAGANSSRDTLRRIPGLAAQRAAVAPVQGGPQRGLAPTQAPGGLEILAAANTNELSAATKTGKHNNGHLTRDYVEQLKDKGVSLGQAFAALVNGGHLSYGETSGINPQLYTGVKVGGSPDAAVEGRKLGLSIANANYKLNGDPYEPLPTTLNDQKDMLGALDARGYETMGLTDQSEDQIRGAAATLQNDRGLAAGDEVVLHFAGHGARRGLYGINYGVYRYPQMTAAASALTDRGVGVRMVLDCCHSGAASDRVRKEFFKAEASKPIPSTSGSNVRLNRPKVVGQAQALESVKRDFIGEMGHVRRAHEEFLYNTEEGVDPYAEMPELKPSGWDEMTGAQRVMFEVKRYSESIEILWRESFEPKVQEILASLSREFPHVAWPMDMSRGYDGLEQHFAIDKLDDTLNLLITLLENETLKE